MAEFNSIPFYLLKNEETLVEDIISILTDVYISDSLFMVIIEEPLSSSDKWLNFFNLYLREINIIKEYD